MHEYPQFIGRQVRISSRIYPFRSEAIVGQLAKVVDAEFYTNSGHLARLHVQFVDGSVIRDLKYHEVDFLEESHG